MDDFQFDEIGYWSEVKLDIIREYAGAYSRILAAQRKPTLAHLYVDGFAGGGFHKGKGSGEAIPGSPANALAVDPPFREYHFIDLDKQKAAALERLSKTRKDVTVYHGDCSEVLLGKVLPRARYEDYRRALCVLDPYGLHLDWNVIAEAGRMRSVEIFLNFPVADINRNVLWKNRDGVPESQRARLTRFWGDRSWEEAAYQPGRQAGLFGPPADEKAGNDEIAAAFRQRLVDAAGFAYVPQPVAMRNSNNAIVYYLFFAAQKPVAADIVQQVFAKYRSRGGT